MPNSAHHHYHSPESRNRAGLAWRQYLTNVAAEAPSPITSAADLAAGIPFADLRDVETVCFHLRTLESTNRLLKAAIARIQGSELRRDQFGPITDYRLFAKHASAAKLEDFELIGGALRPLEYLHVELREAIERIQDAPQQYAETMNQTAA